MRDDPDTSSPHSSPNSGNTLQVAKSRSSNMIWFAVGIPLVMLVVGVLLIVSAVSDGDTATRSVSMPAEIEVRTPEVSASQADFPEAVRETSVALQTPWLELDAQTRLTRIGVGSCLSQLHPQPIWEGVLGLKQRPELFLMLGDNVYGDIKSPGGDELIEAYRMQAVQPEFATARAALPFLATWDDHDYGLNDGGADFQHRELSTELFLDFWKMAPPQPAGGIYYSRYFGPDDARVQIIMLDTRSFRSALKVKGDLFPFWGRYEPSFDPDQTMLGEAQWQWLEAELKKPAKIRLLISSIQVLSEGHGFERWGNLAKERARLLQLLGDVGARGTILLSGDRHASAIYYTTVNGSQVVPELTASSLNRPYGPSRDGRTDELLTALFSEANFGLVDIDWERAQVALTIKGVNGETLESLRFKFADLGIEQ